MKLLDGKVLFDTVTSELKDIIAEMKENGQNVSLAVIQVGNDPASSVYVNNKEKACKEIGIQSHIYRLPEDVDKNTLVSLIKVLNSNDDVNGILVQLPLPKYLNEKEILSYITPNKDVDGFHESNIGKLVIGDDTFVPCTAKGIIELLLRNNIKIDGMNCVVVGRSNIVGKPVALELLRHNGTVTICHSHTSEESLKSFCKEADLLICAIGKPKFFNREYIGANTVVVDVGIHRQENGKLCGDVDFEDVKDVVSAITPVPGGVGKTTICMLMYNCVKAAQTQYAEQ